jgi:hypothetical protein
MRFSIKAALLLTSAAMLTAGSCGTKRAVEHLPTPPERLICERAGTRPSLPAEHEIDWAQVRTLPQARAEHEKFKTVLRTREGLVAGYILRLEGVNFVCWNNMQWRRDFEARLPKPAA